MNHASLFSGIGGFDLAAESMGWQNIFHCDINSFCNQVLKYYWPNAISYENIKSTDFTIHRGRIDILTGGFPCQPYSQAGKRLGKEDERHLWPEMLRAIREIQPRWVVGENVSGITNWNGGVVFNEVQTDLENEGYEVQAYLLPACGVNAPHKRERVWFIAFKNTMHNGCLQREYGKEGTENGEQRNTCTGNSNGVCLSERIVANSGNKRCNNWCNNWEKRHIQGNERTTSENKPEWNGWECRTCKTCKIASDTNGTRRRKNTWRINGKPNEFNKNGKTRIILHSNNTGLQRIEKQRSIEESRTKRNEQPTRFFQPNWENFPTQSPICGRDDGISTELAGITFSKHRNESIKGYGNAVVPRVVLQIFKAIELFDNNFQKKLDI